MKNDPYTSLVLIIIVIILVFLATAKSQVHITVQPPITIQWDHSFKDIEGNDECVKTFGIFMQRIAPDTSDWWLVGQTHDGCWPNTEFVLDSIPMGEHRVAVVAWDQADNASDWHWSTDATAMGGGWTILLDVIEPAKATRLRVQ